jgi:small conductance mechanosensitive channel
MSADTVVGWIIQVAGAIGLFLAAYFLAGWVRKLVGDSLDKANVEPTLGRFSANMSRWLIILLAAVGCLGIFGVQTTSFAAVLGASALAIGLAFQGSLSNLAAGVMLLVFRPFKVGDVVKVAGHTGKCEEIALFTTLLDTPDNRRIVLPNSAVFGATIENVSFHDTRRVDISVGVDYDAALDRTREVLQKVAAAAEPRLEDKDPEVSLVGLGTHSVDWQVRVWCKAADFGATKEALTGALKEALDEAGIGMPFPQMDVHLRDGLKAVA